MLLRQNLMTLLTEPSKQSLLYLSTQGVGATFTLSGSIEPSYHMLLPAVRHIADTMFLVTI